MPPRPTRRHSSPVAAKVLAQMTAARAALDADAAARRSREDELLREFAAAAGDAAAAAARRDSALADLEQRREAIVAAAAADAAATGARQAAALAGLNEFRTAEEIGALVGMNEKRVRAAIRAHRATAAPDSQPAQVVARGPLAADQPTAPPDVAASAAIPTGDDARHDEWVVPEHRTDLAGPPPAALASAPAETAEWGSGPGSQ